MLENKLLVSFLFGLIISLIYYYVNNNSEEEKDESKIGIYLTIFIFTLIITYLIQIGYISNKKSGGSVSENIIDGGQSYKAPF
tara:strand:+ start:241 stop:489 length:249 start_codon:yes stop_codon:yes gene_type:complete